MALRTSKKLLFAAVCTAIVWILLEILVSMSFEEELRAWSAPTPAARQGAPNLPGNPYLLWEIAPGQRKEQGVTITINSDGMRGREVIRPKPEGIRRFMTLGD
ncbi:MAG: hypothetical protein QGG40_20015, partial [Myxococcota bacterium]|nr:hypothetical protein [Myxococcota bacterium]